MSLLDFFRRKKSAKEPAQAEQVASHAHEWQIDLDKLPKILLIYAHPEPYHSVANKVLLQAIKGLTHVTVHDLYATYPDFMIDVEAEQTRLLEHDVIVFQHPMFMYSCPALMKEWLDVVLGKGFAFGQGQALKGKYWRTVITTGGSEKAFSALGYNQYPMEEILQPFELTAKLCQMHWVDPFVVYWARNISDVERADHAQDYRQWLLNPFNSEHLASQQNEVASDISINEESTNESDDTSLNPAQMTANNDIANREITSSGITSNETENGESTANQASVDMQTTDDTQPMMADAEELVNDFAMEVPEEQASDADNQTDVDNQIDADNQKDEPSVPRSEAESEWQQTSDESPEGELENAPQRKVTQGGEHGRHD